MMATNPKSRCWLSSLVTNERNRHPYAPDKKTSQRRAAKGSIGGVICTAHSVSSTAKAQTCRSIESVQCTELCTHARTLLQPHLAYTRLKLYLKDVLRLNLIYPHPNGYYCRPTSNATMHQAHEHLFAEATPPTAAEAVDATDWLSNRLRPLTHELSDFFYIQPENITQYPNPRR